VDLETRKAMLSLRDIQRGQKLLVVNVKCNEGNEITTRVPLDGKPYQCASCSALLFYSKKRRGKR
jgi:hypothetical protein